MTSRNLIILLALVAIAAGTASGQPDDVWKLVSNFKGWPVSKLTVSGVDDDEAKSIKEGIDLAGKDAVLYEQKLRDDIARIRLYFARRGYPHSQIEPEVIPNESRRKIELTLKVHKGPPVVVKSRRLGGVPEEYRDDIEPSLRIGEGDVFVDEYVQSDIETVVEGLRDEGHAKATAGVTLDWIDTTAVALRIVAVPGPVYYFREATVQGVSPDLEQLAYTLTDIKHGERFKPSIVSDARDYLGRAGLFRQIRITLDDAGPDSLDVLVDLQERKPRSIETAVGYWSDEKFSGRVRWQHRNIFKRGRGTSIEAQYTQYRRWGEVSVWWPALFGLKRSLGSARAGIKNENEDSYEMLAPGIGISYGYSFTRQSSGAISLNLERASYTVKTDESDIFQDPKGPIGWLEARLSRDGTDDRINPREGWFSWFRFQWGPRGGVSESNWILGELNATYMQPIKATVIAANVRAGWGKPLEPAFVLLPDKRFYAGGSSAHRGFYRRKLGPKDSNGLPLGGEVLATGFFEFRFPIAWKVQGAAFLDWGQVWRTREDVGMGNIEFAVGPALRIITPVGPVRLDWGFRITDYDATEPASAFHFAIGYPM